MKKSHGGYSKRGRQFKQKGRLSIKKLLADYKEGEMVRVDPQPTLRSGRPHLRFHGLVGKIEGKVGRAYKVALKVGGKVKTLVVTNVHLHRMNAQ